MTTVTKTHEYNSSSSEDFPSLGAMAPKLKEKKKTISPGKSSGKGVKITDLGFTSLIDDHKSKLYGGRGGRGGRGAFDAKRAEAYKRLQQDPAAMAERLHGTRLCWSVQKGVRCPHGDKCNFAHTKSALRMADCLFGDKCRFVQYYDGSYHNKRSSYSKNCTYRHPEETRENYMTRTGIDKIELKVPHLDLPQRAVKDKVKDIELVPVQVLIKALTKKAAGDSESSPIGSALLSRKRSWAKIASKDDDDESSDELDDDELDDANEELDDDDDDANEEPEHVTYTVPESLAIDTLKAAIASGHKKITLTIF
jgi:hypothetical protein